MRSFKEILFQSYRKKRNFMNYTEVTDLVYEYVENYNSQNNFQSASENIKDLIYSMKKDQFIPLIKQIGVIPEKIIHDSKEEKLFSKVSEICLGKCFEELGFSTSLYVTRADTADVLAKSKFHNYSLVSDAKAFRLSRTAKNQKDFKVESMDAWRGDNDYAVLCCPYYQYPKKSSAIFKQSLDKNISLLSWEHFSFLIENNIKETIDLNLSYLWNFPYIQSKTTIVSDSENNYFENQNKYIVENAKLNFDLFQEFFNQSKIETMDRCDEEISFWENEIKRYTKEQAIKKLIDSLKINQKIEHIKKYRQDLFK